MKMHSKIIRCFVKRLHHSSHKFNNYTAPPCFTLDYFKVDQISKS